jgi:hypothetical protein
MAAHRKRYWYYLHAVSPQTHTAALDIQDLPNASLKRIHFQAIVVASVPLEAYLGKRINSAVRRHVEMTICKAVDISELWTFTVERLPKALKTAIPIEITLDFPTDLFPPLLPQKESPNARTLHRVGR